MVNYKTVIWQAACRLVHHFVCIKGQQQRAYSVASINKNSAEDPQKRSDKHLLPIRAILLSYSNTKYPRNSGVLTSLEAEIRSGPFPPFHPSKLIKYMSHDMIICPGSPRLYIPRICYFLITRVCRNLLPLLYSEPQKIQERYLSHVEYLMYRERGSCRCAASKL